MNIYVKNFADLMDGQSYAEIRCYYSKKVIRKLTVKGKRVSIDAIQPPIVSVPLDTPITFTPWVMDRGNLNFECAEVPNAKICGEFDTITYPNGTTKVICHAENDDHTGT